MAWKGRAWVGNRHSGKQKFRNDLNGPKTPKMSERLLKTLQDFPTSKLNTRVRFPSPAPIFLARGTAHFFDDLILTKAALHFLLLAFRPTVFRISHIPAPLFSERCELIKTEDFGLGKRC
jgi:hypothetical protein